MSLAFLTAFAREVWPHAREVVMNPATGDFEVRFTVSRRELLPFRVDTARVAAQLADKLRPRRVKRRQLHWGRRRRRAR